MNPSRGPRHRQPGRTTPRARGGGFLAEGTGRGSRSDGQRSVGSRATRPVVRRPVEVTPRVARDVVIAEHPRVAGRAAQGHGAGVGPTVAVADHLCVPRRVVTRVLVLRLRNPCPDGLARDAVTEFQDRRPDRGRGNGNGNGIPWQYAAGSSPLQPLFQQPPAGAA